MNILYCDKKLSNTGTCVHLATYKSKFITKKNKDNGQITTHHRCDQHKTTSTVHTIWLSSEPITQYFEIDNIITTLKTYIGKEITSSWHRNKYPLIGKFIKDCGIMCLEDKTKKWVYVYYHQIVDFPI